MYSSRIDHKTRNDVAYFPTEELAGRAKIFD